MHHLSPPYHLFSNCQKNSGMSRVPGSLDAMTRGDLLGSLHLMAIMDIENHLLHNKSLHLLLYQHLLCCCSHLAGGGELEEEAEVVWDEAVYPNPCPPSATCWSRPRLWWCSTGAAAGPSSTGHSLQEEKVQAGHHGTVSNSSVPEDHWTAHP